MQFKKKKKKKKKKKLVFLGINKSFQINIFSA
jgi:hypothetical protein